jgi:hypothetical protein
MNSAIASIRVLIGGFALLILFASPIDRVFAQTRSAYDPIATKPTNAPASKLNARVTAVGKGDDVDLCEIDKGSHDGLLLGDKLLAQRKYGGASYQLVVTVIRDKAAACQAVRSFPAVGDTADFAAVSDEQLELRGRIAASRAKADQLKRALNPLTTPIEYPLLRCHSAWSVEDARLRAKAQAAGFIPTNLGPPPTPITFATIERHWRDAERFLSASPPDLDACRRECNAFAKLERDTFTRAEETAAGCLVYVKNDSNSELTFGARDWSNPVGGVNANERWWHVKPHRTVQLFLEDQPLSVMRLNAYVAIKGWECSFTVQGDSARKAIVFDATEIAKELERRIAEDEAVEAAKRAERRDQMRREQNWDTAKKWIVGSAVVVGGAVVAYKGLEAIGSASNYGSGSSAGPAYNADAGPRYEERLLSCRTCGGDGKVLIFLNYERCGACGGSGQRSYSVRVR